MEILSQKQKELGLTNLEYSIFLILGKRFPEIDHVKDSKELVEILKKLIYYQRG